MCHVEQYYAYEYSILYLFSSVSSFTCFSLLSFIENPERTLKIYKTVRPKMYVKATYGSLG